ncbi:MAG: WD40/YVTN/BNR-like repeat-containing protein [Promethearchaeota archaeon]
MKKSITPYKIVMCCLVILLSMTMVISLIIARNANSTMYSINLTAEKTDGWVALNSPTTEDLRDIVFVDNKTGWIVGTSGTILHTTDGFNWSIQASGTSNDLETVDFINSTFGWAMGSDYIKTTDGGNTWIVKSTLNAPYPNEIDLYNETLGFGGGIGAIFQMKDEKTG